MKSPAESLTPAIPAVALLATDNLTVMFANADFLKATGLSVGMRFGEQLSADELQGLERGIRETITSGESHIIGGSFCLDRQHKAAWSLQAVPTINGAVMPDMVFLISSTSITRAALMEKIDQQGTTIEQQDDAIVTQEETIDQQARLLKLLMIHVPWGVIVADADFRIERMSDYGGHLLGFPKRDFEGRYLGAKGTLSHVFHEDETEASFEELPLYRAVKNGQVLTGEEWWCPDGSGRNRRALLCNAAPIYDEEKVIVGGITTFGDITPMKDIAETLHSLLKQKGVLLSEIHHRVKNNLQIVSSIAIAEKLRHPEAAAAIDSIIGYIATIGAIHETLGLSPDASAVPFGHYARKICRELRNLYNASAIDMVVVGVEELPLDIATPLGLIVNELVSNSLKHAFPDHGAGEVKVSLVLKEGFYILEVFDDGIGLPADCYRQSLGMRLVKRLVQQLGGGLQSVDSPAGTKWQITFPHDKNQRRATAS